jgi:hypothetical protein
MTLDKMILAEAANLQYSWRLGCGDLEWEAEQWLINTAR